LSGETTRTRDVICHALDADIGQEVVTVAHAGTRSEVRIWSWDGSVGGLRLEAVGTWDASFADVAAMDLDGDGEVELVLGGSTIDGSDFSGDAPALWVLHWDGDAIEEEAHYVWSRDDVDVEGDTPALYAVAAADINGDGSGEILTLTEVAGAFDLRVWHLEAGSIVQRAQRRWQILGSSHPMELAVGELDGTPPLEILAVGSTEPENGSSDSGITRFGVAALLHWTEGGLVPLAEDVWASERGNVEFFGAGIGDVDADGTGEAIAGGAVHASPGYSVLRIFEWAADFAAPQVALSDEWIPEPMLGSFVYGLYSGDLNGDGDAEVLTYGRSISASGRDYAQLDIWGRRDSYPFFFLYWLEDVLSFRGWPFYQAFRDTLPMPWPPLIYGCGILAAFVFVGYAFFRGFWPRPRRPR
jgi:hypothetical protein